ncbi:MAG: hypothetical protein PQJ45_02970 [Sphaerochaetaceae bacterium]|nr:hypothetical protein [Sphaerochaetaceae bacterium]
MSDSNNLDLQIVKTVCAIVKYNNKVCLVKKDSSDTNSLWNFPQVVVNPSEIVISALINYINKTFCLDIDTIDVNYLCNIKHKCETFFLDIDSFVVDLKPTSITEDLIDNQNWFEIEELFNIPLTAEAVTLAQVLMEC